MATTPNYGWVTPAPTNFVTNLPADFEAFADAVDAEVFKKVNRDVVEAKGDLIVGTADETVDNLPVGTDGQVLAADSTQSTGLAWVDPAAPNLFANKVELTSSGNWTVPAGVTQVQVFCISGGGGGGAGATYLQNSGAGGKGGDIVYHPAYTVTPGADIAYTIGGGGNGGNGFTATSAISGSAGNYGSATTFGWLSTGQTLWSLSHEASTTFSASQRNGGSNIDGNATRKKSYGGNTSQGFAIFIGNSPSAQAANTVGENGIRGFDQIASAVGGIGSNGTQGSSTQAGGTASISGYCGTGGNGGGAASTGTTDRAGGAGYNGGGGGGAGDGASSGTVTAGSGGNGGANTGGGGGGGGAAVSTSAANATSGGGGNGGSGVVLIFY